MNINFYRLNKTKNYLFLNLEKDITDETAFLNKLASTLSGGVDIFQIKNTILSAKSFVELSNKIKLICAELNVIFLVSDRIDIALVINPDGIYLDKDELPAHFARHLLGDDKIIGSADTADTDADFYITNEKASLKTDKIYFRKKSFKQFQGNYSVFLYRAYP